MAYLRFSNDCDWYVFDGGQEGESESHVAVWHKDYESQRASYTVSMIRKMLESGDYSNIPGYQPHHKRLLHDAFEVPPSNLSGWLCVHASKQGRAARSPKSCLYAPKPSGKTAQP
jgi:hypothetical protein